MLEVDKELLKQILHKRYISNYIEEKGDLLYKLKKEIPAIANEYKDYPTVKIISDNKLFSRVKTTVKKLTKDQYFVIKEYAEVEGFLKVLYVNKVECYRVMI